MTRSGRQAWNSRSPSRPFGASRTVAPPRSSKRPHEAANIVVVVDHEHAGFAHTPFIPRPCAVPSLPAEASSVATILIVDPDPATRSLLELLCARLGHTAIGPREWVEGEEPDLLLLEPASRPGVRLARGVQAPFPPAPMLCVINRQPERRDAAARGSRPRDEALPPDAARARARAGAHPHGGICRYPADGVGPGALRRAPGLLHSSRRSASCSRSPRQPSRRSAP